MTQADKTLLLQDLCARLPYGVIGECTIDASYDTAFETIYQVHKFNSQLNGIEDYFVSVIPFIEDEEELEFANEEVKEGVDLVDIKPYLRPMSSMTEKEKKEYELLANHCIVTSIGFVHLEAQTLIDWLNAHHFDYRGLIEKGLAIAVTEENNPYK